MNWLNHLAKDVDSHSLTCKWPIFHFRGSAFVVLFANQLMILHHLHPLNLGSVAAYVYIQMHWLSFYISPSKMKKETRDPVWDNNALRE